MQKIQLMALAGILLTSATLSAREWTNVSEKTITADYVSHDDDQVVLSMNGKEYRIPIKSLSEADQTFLNETQKEETQPETADETVGKATKNKSKKKGKVAFNFDTFVSGDEITPEQREGKLIVFHQWHEHCETCLPKLAEFEKIARRKKKLNAVFMIWHSIDKVEKARTKAERLDLDLPIYHGRLVKWDEKFGDFTWPHVVVMKSDGEIIYMGKLDSEFNKILKENTEE